MSGSSIGKAFSITTFGESHGEGTGVVIQGCPPGMDISEKIIQKDLDRRRPGKSVASTARNEPDKARIVSGVFEGKTTGTPIMIYIKNKDARSKSYDDIARLFRPGHGDFTYRKKYGMRDHRGGGRASARETAARVAAGAVAKLVLEQENIFISSYTLEIGGIKAEKTDDILLKDRNDLQCPDPEAAQKMTGRLKLAKKRGDSLGGIVKVSAVNVPAGLGEPVFDKLDADIAKALMSIGAVKAVGIGAGIGCVHLTGYENNDQISSRGFKTNNAGGILAGISNGEDIDATVYVKPIPSIGKKQNTIDENNMDSEISIKGRHDVCAIPRINMVCEAMLSIVLTDHLLRQKAVRF